MNEAGGFQSCYKCTDRRIGCHSDCAAYQNEKQKYETFREYNRNYLKMEHDFIMDRRKRARKK